MIGAALSSRILQVIRRGAQAMYKRGAVVTPLGKDGGAQAKLSTLNNKTTVQIINKQYSIPMAKYADVCA
jgi:hypothetical protein